MTPSSHPRELYVLFFTEMWERFGYYLMLAIFVLYLNEHRGLSTGDAASLYGTYIGLAYLSPLLGGFLADRLLGHRRSILMGAAVLSLGYFLLALDRTAVFYVALGVLILGNGLFKPNIAALVGSLYAPGDQRRDAGFGIFYLGVNLGALMSPFVASYARNRWGWSGAFAAAGVGMSLGFATFALFGGKLGQRKIVVLTPAEAAALAQAAPETAEDRESARERLRALLVSCLIVVSFWIAFQQNGSTLTLWARDNTDLTLHGLLSKPLDPVLFQSVNSFFILALTPVMLGVFQWLRARGSEPSTPAKIALGMVLTGVAYGVMALASLLGGDTGRVSALWLVGSYFVITIGELFVSPMGLSMVSKLAPRGTAALMIGVWYTATAAGNKVAGELGVYWSRWSHHGFFLVLTVCSVTAAVVLAVQLPRLVAAMDGKPRPRRSSGRFMTWALARTPSASA